jgi:ureidoacrylate peracid hydrolase
VSGALLSLAAQVAPAHAAVLVVDMQNDFCAAGGYIDRVIKRDLTACREVAKPVNELVALARAAKIPVIWLRANYARDLIPEPMRAKLERQNIAEVCCAPGSWGADWFGVRPFPAEAVIEKHCYSGFMGTDLHERLKALGVRTLVFSGVQTQVCVESTLRDAHSLGYYCVVPEDCVASHTPPAHQATLAGVRFLFGEVTTLAELKAIWAAH